MSSFQGNGPPRPLYVRFTLSGAGRRRTAWRYTFLMAGLTVVAAVIGDPALLGLALVGVVAYLWSIRWMDRNHGWDDDLDVGASPGANRDHAGGFDATAPDRHLVPDAAPIAARPATSTTSTSPSIVVAVLAGVTTAVYLLGLFALESHGAPTGSHLLAVILDALFGVGFGGGAMIVALRRPRIPYERAVTLTVSVGLGLVAGLGFLIASNGMSTTSDGLALGTGAAMVTLVAGSGAAFWLTARSGGRLGWIAAGPVVLVGWYLGFAAWVAHIHSV